MDPIGNEKFVHLIHITNRPTLRGLVLHIFPYFNPNHKGISFGLPFSKLVAYKRILFFKENILLCSITYAVVNGLTSSTGSMNCSILSICSFRFVYKSKIASCQQIDGCTFSSFSFIKCASNLQ